MNPENGRPAAEYGLAANGSSCKWEAAVEESLDGTEWMLEMEGPHTYIAFRLAGPDAIAAAMRFLQAPPGPSRAGEFLLGRFDSASVSLLWDNEDFTRCFLLIGPKAGSTFRLSLDAEDVQMLIEAMGQVLEELTQADRESSSVASQ